MFKWCKMQKFFSYFVIVWVNILFFFCCLWMNLLGGVARVGDYCYLRCENNSVYAYKKK